MCKFNIIENAQEFSAILLHCGESVKQLTAWHMIITSIKFPTA
jgi:hypothetical protein